MSQKGMGRDLLGWGATFRREALKNAEPKACRAADRGQEAVCSLKSPDQGLTAGSILTCCPKPDPGRGSIFIRDSFARVSPLQAQARPPSWAA